MVSQKAPTSRLRPAVTPREQLAKRAALDFIQDLFENVPFASVGGLDKRDAMTAPHYIPEEQREDYLLNYRLAALWELGPDWQTCTFSWQAAIRLDPKETPDG